MSIRDYNLALETTTRSGSITLGRGDLSIASVDLPPQRRHSVDLMPEIDRLCKLHNIRPKQFSEIYVSVGPGSFTGLRIGIATAKTLAHVLQLKLVAVPTLDVLAQNAPADLPSNATIAVCITLKADTVYGGLFRKVSDRWMSSHSPELISIDGLLAKSQQHLWVLGHPLPDAVTQYQNVTVLPMHLASPQSDVVWAMGRRAACNGDFVQPLSLAPLYIREPEAEELWKRRNP